METGLSLDLELADLSRVADQQAPGSLLFLRPSAGIQEHAVRHECRGSELSDVVHLGK